MNLHRLDLVSLALFSRVARTGSISRGAELMHLAVGAASQRILADLDQLDVVSLPADTLLAQRLEAESAAGGGRLRVRIRVRSFDAMCQRGPTHS